MQTPTRMDKVVIKDYYHMTTVDENVNGMKLTNLLSISSLYLRGPCWTFMFTSIFLITFNL